MPSLTANRMIILGIVKLRRRMTVGGVAAPVSHKGMDGLGTRCLEFELGDKGQVVDGHF